MIKQIKILIKQITSKLMIKSKVLTLRTLGNGGHIVLLMYHRVNNERDVHGLSISPHFFEQQLEYLKTCYKIISLRDAVSMLATGTISGTYACVTFDDGYRDNYDYAFPLLKKYNVPATIFVTVDGLESGFFGWYTFDKSILDSNSERIDLTEFDLGLIDIRTIDKKQQAISYLHRELKICAHSKREMVVRKIINDLAYDANHDRVMLTWNAAQEMLASGLVTIGAHTLTHPILTRVDHSVACNEIVQSKAVIEEKLGNVVELFAYPNGRRGDFNNEIIGFLQDAGYLAACTTIPGLIIGGEDLFRLPRISVNYRMCEGLGGRFSSDMFASALLVPSLER